MRLFIALPLPETERRRLAEVSDRLAGIGRLIPPERFHVTLRFLGETDAESAARRILHQTPFEPIRVAFGDLIVLGRQRVVAASVRPTAPLEALYDRLDRASREQGFPAPEYDTFRPHVTLVRSRSAIPQSRVPREPVGGGFTAERVVLYRSEHRDGRLIYTPLAERVGT